MSAILPSVEQQTLLAAVRELIPKIQADAGKCDARAAFPRQAFDDLLSAGILSATLPTDLGGKNFGYHAEGAVALLSLFLLLGEGSLAVARLFEAHVNALQLITLYGSHQLRKRTAQDVEEGNLFALWVTDPFASQVMLKSAGDRFILEGLKAFCSGAGVATRALITAATPTGIQMLVVSLQPNTRVLESPVKLAGMRAAITGSVDLSGIVVAPEDLVGTEGDYLREPTFSAGAWRSSAGALGGLNDLVKLHRGEILQRKRDGDPHQRARFGQLVIAYETARLWLELTAQKACLLDDCDEGIVAYINLARIAVEAACLDAIELTQRSLGLGALIAGAHAERICRDLAIYLRQPAPDETLDKAANYYFHAALPGDR